MLENAYGLYKLKAENVELIFRADVYASKEVIEALQESAWEWDRACWNLVYRAKKEASRQGLPCTWEGMISDKVYTFRADVTPDETAVRLDIEI